MIKLFLIITGAVLLAGAIFAVQNRNSFIQTRNDKDKTNDDIDAVLDKIENTEFVAINSEFEKLWAAEQDLAQKKADLELTNEKIAATSAEIQALKAKVSPLDEKLAEAQKAIDLIKEKFPGVTLDNIGKTIKQYELDLDEAKQALAAKNAEIEIVDKKITVNNATIGRYVKRQSVRQVGIARNGTEGIITAVNQDWGFVVVNVGKSRGVTPESSMIIKRGTENVGRLSIVSIEERLTVADIIGDSLKKGTKIVPYSTG